MVAMTRDGDEVARGERREAKNPASNTGERAWTVGNTGSGETILANKIKDYLYIVSKAFKDVP